jgi:hypothetical protein
VIERGVRQRVADRISERECRRSIHDRVFPHEPRARTVKHDHLYRLVYPAIAKTMESTMPKEAGGGQKVAWCRRIQAEYESGRVNRVEQRRVRWREGTEVHVIRCPQVPVCRSQRTNGGKFGSRCRNDMLDLATEDVSLTQRKMANGRNRDSRFQFGRAKNVAMLGSVKPPKVPIA